MSNYDYDLNKAIARWIYWNQRIEEGTKGRPSYFWRVEDKEDGLLQWLLDQGAVQDIDPDALYSNRERNPHRNDVQAEARWADIAEHLRAPLCEMMDRYVYKWED